MDLSAGTNVNCASTHDPVADKVRGRGQRLDRSEEREEGRENAIAPGVFDFDRQSVNRIVCA